MFKIEETSMIRKQRKCLYANETGNIFIDEYR